MKYLIYELFSGVGLCNQLFSLETAIYLASISNRKLILLIVNPLCHCGKASWDYGYLLNFFTNEFLNYLPNGFEVYYKKIPDNITNIINDHEQTKQMVYKNRFSQLVFVDKELDTEVNEQDIKDFCHHRDKCYLGFEENDHFTYLYITQSNASRCFYNFYTTPDKYKLMYDICTSLKFKDIFYEISNNIYSDMSKSINSYTIFLHLRFGDYHKPQSFLSRNNDVMLNNIIPYVDGHKTNLITPKVFLLCDNTKNTDFLNKISKYKPVMIDGITNIYFDSYFKNNNMLFYDFHKTINNSVNHAIIDMLLSVKSDEFVGTTSSTFSHYIQFLRYIKNKSYNNYSNITDGTYCRFSFKEESKYDWIKYKYNSGHPVSWHAFWDIHFNPTRTLMTIHGKTDGFGSQLQAIFSMIAYCYYKGYTYIHTPMYTMHHIDELIQDFPSYMNRFINVESKFSSIDQISSYDQTIVHKQKEGNFVHGSHHPEYFYNDHVLNVFREMYFSTEKPELLYDDKYKNVAVHIRRGDVNANKYPSRFITNAKYIDLLSKMKLEGCILHIFSEGSESDFGDIVSAFPGNEVVMHINEPVQLTFHHLVMADVLVVSKSSFSYCAGLLNNNTKIANFITNWWHKPLGTWDIA